MIGGIPFDAIRPPDKGTFRRRVALTFDDGPGAGTAEVLNVLRRRGLKATFFIHGRNIVGREALISRIVREGHLIANHGEQHADLSKAADATRSCQDTWSRLERFALPGAIRWFRFPGGRATLDSREAVEDLGHCVVGWHIDSADWCYADPRGGRGVCDKNTFRWVDDDVRRDLPANVLKQVQAFSGGIVLLHDDRTYTAETLDEIITALAFGGFGFTTLLDDVAFPQLVSRARLLRDALEKRSLVG